MFPPANAQFYFNDSGEVVAWDVPGDDPYEPDEDNDPYDPDEDDEEIWP